MAVNTLQKDIVHGTDMARKAKSNSLIKSKGLFDHLNHLREKQDPHYFDTLTEADKKSWSNYMVCRFLSMQPEILDYVNEVQKFASILEPREFYRLLLSIVPLGRAYFPYVKNKSDKKWSKELLKLLRKHYQESERNVTEYLDLLKTEELRDIVSLYGYTEKEIENLISTGE